MDHKIWMSNVSNMGRWQAMHCTQRCNQRRKTWNVKAFQMWSCRRSTELHGMTHQRWPWNTQHDHQSICVGVKIIWWIQWHWTMAREDGLIPAPQGQRLVQGDASPALGVELHKNYASGIHKLMCLAKLSLPYIGNAVWDLARHMHAPNKDHWNLI